MASAVKGFIGIGVAIIAFTFVGIAVSNGLKDIENAEKWMAYENGVCRFIDGLPDSECGGQQGLDAYNKYYGQDKIRWVYGENPRLGQGPLAN